ncbi:MAG: hypothetical protein ABSF71_10635 [Terriglobia bacterium]|jgi:hypothetical protein
MSIDPILELGWIKLDSDYKLAAQLAVKAETYRKETQSEADTIAIFVEPILRGLGWDTLTPKEVSRQSPRKYPLSDLWLLAENGSKIAVLIEVKPISFRNFRDRDRRQLDVNARSLIDVEEGELENDEKLCLDDGHGRIFLYGVLTSGGRWEVYDYGMHKAATNAPSVPPRLLCKFDFATGKDGLRELFSYLGKDPIMRKVRETLGRDEHTDSSG